MTEDFRYIASHIGNLVRDDNKSLGLLCVAGGGLRFSPPLKTALSDRGISFRTYVLAQDQDRTVDGPTGAGYRVIRGVKPEEAYPNEHDRYVVLDDDTHLGYGISGAVIFTLNRFPGKPVSLVVFDDQKRVAHFYRTGGRKIIPPNARTRGSERLRKALYEASPRAYRELEGLGYLDNLVPQRTPRGSDAMSFVASSWRKYLSHRTPRNYRRAIRPDRLLSNNNGNDFFTGTQLDMLQSLFTGKGLFDTTFVGIGEHGRMGATALKDSFSACYGNGHTDVRADLHLLDHFVEPPEDWVDGKAVVFIGPQQKKKVM